MKKMILLVTVLLTAVFMSACNSSSQLKKTLEENPDIVFNVIEKHPKKFFDVISKAQVEARKKAQESAMQEEQTRLEEEFKNPKKPQVDTKRAIFGPDNAPITIVEYSDFQCPYCTRGYNTIKKVMAEYGDKVRVLYKHLPLDFHPEAMPAAQFYEAIALQSEAKAKKFHDYIFENQQKLKTGKQKFLKEAARKAGANVSKVMKDLESKEVKSRIEADMAEAKKFGFSGTPGFLINGVSLKGAYPFPEFKKIIDRHLGKGDS